MNNLAGILFVILGLTFLIFYKRLAHGTAMFYYRLLQVKFSEKGYQIAFLLGGIGFLVFGLLSLFRLIKFK